MQLGQRVSMHRGTIGAGGWAWYLGAMAILSGLVGIGRGGLALVNGGNTEPLPVGAAALAVGLVLLIVPMSRWRQSVEVFEGGLVWTRLYGVVRAQREQVQSARLIRHRNRNGSHDEVEIDLAGGKSLSIVGVEGSDQLCNFLRAWSAGSVPGPVAERSVGSVRARDPGAGWSPGGWKPPGS